MKVIAKETDSIDKFQSEPLHIIIYVQDSNDNNPQFEQESYQIDLSEDANNGLFDLEILQFKLTDKDSGIYGVNGLVCYLRGEESEK